MRLAIFAFRCERTEVKHIIHYYVKNPDRFTQSEALDAAHTIECAGTFPLDLVTLASTLIDGSKDIVIETATPISPAHSGRSERRQISLNGFPNKHT